MGTPIFYFRLSFISLDLLYIAHEKATKEQRLRVEISQVKKVNAFYLKQADKAHEIEVIQEKKRQKLALPTKENYTLEEMRDKLKIKQRKPVIKGELYSN